MLSSVLRSDRAVRVNVEIMRAFVRMRQLLAATADLARKLDALEKKYDVQFKAVFDAIRTLMAPPPAEPKPRRIGFHAEPEVTLSVEGGPPGPRRRHRLWLYYASLAQPLTRD